MNTEAEQLAVDWINWLELVKNRPLSTRTTYARVLKHWLEWADEHGLDPLRPELEELEGFCFRHLPKRKRRSAADKAKHVAVLKGWFKWMFERDYLEENYALDLQGPTPKRKEGRPIPDTDWAAMWDGLAQPRHLAVYGTGFFCGLRAAELASIGPENITDTRLRSIVRKGGNEHTVPYVDMALLTHQRLPQLLPDPERYLSAVRYVRTAGIKMFPWQLVRTLNDHMKDLCVEVGVPHYTPHQLRHSTATNLLRMGVEPHTVMRLMNHSSFDMTMRYVGESATSLKGLLE